MTPTPHGWPERFAALALAGGLVCAGVLLTGAARPPWFYGLTICVVVHAFASSWRVR